MNPKMYFFQVENSHQIAYRRNCGPFRSLGNLRSSLSRKFVQSPFLESSKRPNLQNEIGQTQATKISESLRMTCGNFLSRRQSQFLQRFRSKCFAQNQKFGLQCNSNYGCDGTCLLCQFWISSHIVFCSFFKVCTVYFEFILYMDFFPKMPVNKTENFSVYKYSKKNFD